MACTRGSRSGELARSQSVARASIARSSACRWVPSAAGPPSGASVHVRPTASGRRVHAADVSSGSKAGPGSFDRVALNRSATSVRRGTAGRQHGVAAENSRWRRDAPWWPCVHSGRVPGTPPATLPEHAAREGRRRFASRQEIVRGPARRVGLLSPRFEGMVRDRLMSQFAVGGVELLMSGHSVVLGVSSLRGAGLLRCASSRRGTGVSPLRGFHP